MGKILKFRRRGPLPEVESGLARLSDELTLTANFADAMIRGGNYRAAVGVIDEQRGRLEAAEQHVVRAFALPAARRRRTHAALAGLAAVLVIGSASFAALGLHSRQQTQAPGTVVIEQAQQSLAEAATTGSDAKVLEAFASLKALDAALAPASPAVNSEVNNFLNHQLKVIDAQQGRNSRSMALLVQQIQELQKKIEKKLDDSKKPPSDPGAQPPQAPAASTP